MVHLKMNVFYALFCSFVVSEYGRKESAALILNTSQIRKRDHDSCKDKMGTENVSSLYPRFEW